MNDSINKDSIFSRKLLWGSATSAFQVEGNCEYHDFYDWAVKGRVKDGTNPRDAVFFLKNYKEDISLMKKMNHTTARIGLEWARIETEPGYYDEDAIAVYRDILTEMNKKGIAPLVTIHHFSNPLWLVEQGGWTNKKVVDAFTRFAAKVARSLGDLVHGWITINEPSVYAFMAYFLGEFPPGKKGLLNPFRVMKHMAAAHIKTYFTIHEIYETKNWGNPKVGIAKHIIPVDPFREKNILDRVSARLFDRYFNDYFLKKICRRRITLDIFGINYYTGSLVAFPLKRVNRSELPKNKLGWDIYPAGFYRVVMKYYNRYRLPVYITENGTCDDNDELRPGFILDHIHQLFRAEQDGAEIAAYYYWSTLDNFELVDGVMSRFGLIHVDHDSPERERTIKKSGKLFAEIAKANGITLSMIKKFLSS
ncbi:MAG: glycoside hydrolase family 1 protein [bacterium]|nr:glycoside hydrolase family 1 protein [bacterium]